MFIPNTVTSRWHGIRFQQFRYIVIGHKFASLSSVIVHCRQKRYKCHIFPCRITRPYKNSLITTWEHSFWPLTIFIMKKGNTTHRTHPTFDIQGQSSNKEVGGGGGVYINFRIVISCIWVIIIEFWIFISCWCNNCCVAVKASKCLRDVSMTIIIAIAAVSSIHIVPTCSIYHNDSYTVLISVSFHRISSNSILFLFYSSHFIFISLNSI